jgi:uncharacterized membrane protein YagU involved in acid resistance
MSSPQENPYAPPKAVVSDAPEPPRVRPRAVKIAVALLWVELLLALVNWGLSSDITVGTPEAEYKLFTDIFMAIMVAVSAWINIKVWQGRNWARIVALVLTILSFPTLLALPEMYREDALSAALSLAALALDVVAMILVFGPGREWFRRRS